MQANTRKVNEGFPREIPFQTRWRDIAFFSVGTILVVAFINVMAIWYLEDNTFNRGYWIISQKGKVLSSLEGPGYWLIVGDSSGNFGIVPELLDEHLGVSSVNLCTVADMLTMDDFFMVEAYIERHGPPAGVLMVHAYDAWTRMGELGAFARSHWPLEKISRFLGLGRSEYTEMLIKRYFPLYSENTTLTKMSLMPRTAFLRKELPFFMLPDGYMPLKEASLGVQNDAPFHLRRINDIAAVVSSNNLKGLEAIADLANRYQFEVFVINSPLYRKLLEYNDFRNYFSVIQSELLRTSKQFAHMHLLKFSEDMTFSADQMENVDHVIFSAAKIYTSVVAKKIQEVNGQFDDMQ